MNFRLFRFPIRIFFICFSFCFYNTEYVHSDTVRSRMESSWQQCYLFEHSWLITGLSTRVTRQVPHVEQELLILPEHLRSSPVFSGVLCCLIFSLLCNVLLIVDCPFPLTIVLSVLLLFTVSNYPFGIFKLFCQTFSWPKTMSYAYQKHIIMLTRV